MGIYRQKEDLENKVSRVYAHVLEQLRAHFPTQQILICKVNNLELKERVKQACEHREPGGFLTLTMEEPLSWYIIINDVMYIIKMTTAAALKSYTIKILSVEQSTLKAGTPTPFPILQGG